MKRLVIILALLVVLAATLSSCSVLGDHKTTTDTVQTISQTNLDDLVGNDLTANDTGNNDFIEIGEMI